jgi:hypothetical protein
MDYPLELNGTDSVHHIHKLITGAESTLQVGSAEAQDIAGYHGKVRSTEHKTHARHQPGVTVMFGNYTTAPETWFQSTDH